MQGYRLTEDGRLTIEFSSEYSELSGIMEFYVELLLLKPYHK